MIQERGGRELKIAVMAGTPVDTGMGVLLLRKDCFSEVIEIPISETPAEQTVFQISAAEHKERVINAHMDNAEKQGCDVLLVYCNSLSGAVDFKKISEERDIRIVTPLEVYEEMALHYRNIAIISANAQGLAGIERAMFSRNKDIVITGVTLLEMVKEIEKGTAPCEIAEKFNFSGLLEYFRAMGSEAVVLGCTHFPYIREEMERLADVEIIDPGIRMAEKVFGKGSRDKGKL